ncbi:hypothetical protein D516_3955 [Rhodobacter sp. AKP1]|nr:hypothetical protein D516_3955 [Rhodobacter sp. AKP1]
MPLRAARQQGETARQDQDRSARHSRHVQFSVPASARGPGCSSPDERGLRGHSEAPGAPQTRPQISRAATNPGQSQITIQSGSKYDPKLQKTSPT